MAQKGLFGNLKPRGSKKDDAKLLEGTRDKKKVGEIQYVTGDNYRDAVSRARSLSRRLLSNILDRLELLTEEDEIAKYFKAVKKSGYVAFDTETSGLDAIHDTIAGICLYTEGQKGVYIPVNHLSQMTHQPIKGQPTKAFIKEQLQSMVDAGTKIILHNSKFDMKFVYWQLGVNLGAPYWDTYIASMLLNENESHSLKNLHAKYVEEVESKEVAKFNDLFKGVQFNLIPTDVAYMYAANDPIMTWELWKFQERYLTPGTPECAESNLDRVSWVYHNIELPLIPVLFDMEIYGVALDEKLLGKIREEFTAKMEKAEADFQYEVGKYAEDIEELRQIDFQSYQKLSTDAQGNVTVSISSPTQLAILFYDVMKLKSPDDRKARGTGESIVETFDNPIAKALLVYRKYAKLMSTYVTMDRHLAQTDNRIHTTYKQYGAATGRMSSEEPNLQNIPSRGEGAIIRQTFVATEGNYIIGSDYSQQEPRSLAALSGDANMIKAYTENKDLYGVIGSQLYGLPYDDCLEFHPDGTPNPEGKKRRNNVKSVLLGIMYGRGAKAVAEQMNVSVKEADKVIKDFFGEFPKIGEYIIKVQQDAIDYGYVETATGRRRRLPDMALPEYSFEYIDGSKNDNFDPLDFTDESDVSTEVPEYVVEEYWNLLDRAWGYKQKEKIKLQAKEEGIRIHDNGGKIADAERQCLNSVIQGTAADMTKYAMIQVHKDEELKELGFHLTIPVHDELLGEVPKENAKRAAERLTEVMIEGARDIIDLPMKCDPSIVDRWYGEEIEV